MNNMGAHQLNLIGIILEKRSNGWMYKDIANYLNELGYKTSRGREPTAALAERMHKKYLLKKAREQEEIVSVDSITLFC